MGTVPRQSAASRLFIPSLTTAVAAAIVIGGAFLPWYAPDVGPPVIADSVSGWHGTLAARLMVVAAVVALLSSAVLVMDSRGRRQLDTVGMNSLTLVSVAGMLAAAAMVSYRSIRIPEPSDLLSRQIGVYICVAAALVGLVAALVQVLLAFGGDAREQRTRNRRRRSR